MKVIVHTNGDLTVPKRLEGPDGSLGDGTERIGQSHPDYRSWQGDIDRGAVDVVVEPSPGLKGRMDDFKAAPKRGIAETKEHGETGATITDVTQKFTET